MNLQKWIDKHGLQSWSGEEGRLLAEAVETDGEAHKEAKELADYAVAEEVQTRTGFVQISFVPRPTQ